MTFQLPHVLDRYFEVQNAHDVEAIVACFAPDAAVRDEGHDIVGVDAIRSWQRTAIEKYRFTAQPIESRVEAEGAVVVAKVSGTFPGSPVNLTYHFGLSPDGRISTLRIR
jgi:hypothetical protein